MGSLFKKEILHFYGSVSGYLVAVVFLIFVGLFLWVFDGNYNIPLSGYASLDPFFDISPWIYLFLIPAVTMRMFSEEKRNGTLELILTRPLSELRLIIAKFSASLVVVILTLLPTFVYFFSVYQLGSPPGSIDSGATWGSYIGLLFLAIIYIAIGLFTSSLSENQIISFILAVSLCFVWYSGFDFVAESLYLGNLSYFFSAIGIDSHYESISRGVLDIRDLLYFLFTTGFFILATRIVLEWKRRPVKRSIIHLLVYCAVVFIAMALSQYNFKRIDFTAEKRYTISPQTKEILKKVNLPVTAEIFLDGELPSGFRKLENSIIEHLGDMKNYSGQPIVVKTTNPYNEVQPSSQNEYFKSLMKRGIVPTNVRIKTEEGTTTKLIFPAVSLRTGSREVVVNLLQNNVLLRDEENFIHSIELLEYEIARGLKLLFQENQEKIAFLKGHGELDEDRLIDFSKSLKENYEIRHLTTEDLLNTPDDFKALIIANPESRFSERDKFILDQYLMQGGRIMWFINPVHVSLDSLSKGTSTVAFPKDLNLNDQLFNYGVRLNPDLIQDVECLQIKVNTALAGQAPKYSVAPWYFTPLLQPAQNHSIGKNVNRVVAEFVSSIDLVGENDNIKKSIIMSSSSNSKINKSPMIVNLGMIDAPPARSLFNRKNIPTGVLLEGQFSSVFKNRVVEDDNDSGTPIYESKPTKMIFFSNGQMISNKIIRNGNEMRIIPMGYDPVSNLYFGNKDFFVNAVNYLCDDSGFMELRSRTMKMRLLDKVRIREELLVWQIINVVVPVLVILFGGLMFWFLRHRRN